MTRNEIVNALRCCASIGGDFDCITTCAFYNTSDGLADCCTKKDIAAANLIENQQRHIEALMQANAALRDTVLRRDAQIEGMAADRKALKSELCQYCGKYKYAHEGACDGCKWRET